MASRCRSWVLRSKPYTYVALLTAGSFGAAIGFLQAEKKYRAAANTLQHLQRKVDDIDAKKEDSSNVINDLQKQVKDFETRQTHHQLIIDQHREGVHHTPLNIPCSIGASGMAESVQTMAVLDTGSTQSFLSEAFVKEHNIPTYPMLQPFSSRMANGEREWTTEFCEIELAIGKHKENFQVFVEGGDGRADRPLRLGLPWMEKHAILIKPQARAFKFRPKSCPETCLPCRKVEKVCCIEDD